MAASNSIPFPIAGTAVRQWVSFFTSTRALITGWTGASANIYLDGVLQGNLTPVESPANSGLGYIDIPSGYTNGYTIGISASVTNASSTPYAGYIVLTQASPTSTPSAKPTDVHGMVFWIFCYLFGRNNFNKGSGIQTINIPNGNMPNPNTLTTILGTPSDLSILKNESTP